MRCQMYVIVLDLQNTLIKTAFVVYEFEALEESKTILYLGVV